MAAADIPLLALLILLLMAAVFLAAAEASLLRVNEAKARSEAAIGGNRAERLLHLVERLPEVLNLILLLALLAQIGSATVTGILAQRWFGNVAVTVASIVLTVFLYIYGEAIPKTYAVRHSMRTALLVSGPIAFLERLFRPIVGLLVWIADIQMPGKGVTTSSAVTEDELRLLAVEAADQGRITEGDQVLIDRVFRFGDRRVDDIMVPRPDVVAVQVETPVEEALEIALRSGHRRLPVYEGTLENVVGVVKLRDLVAGRDTRVESIRSVAETPLVVPKSKQVTSLLDDMQEQNKHLALVVDEYGVTAGIVTIEDVVEDLVGSISEGPDRIHLERVADGQWIVSGAVPVEDLTAELDIEIPAGEWNTVAGMMLGLSGQVLGPGSVVVVDEHRFRVESVRGRRITRVSVHREADDRV
ncbi:MAG TPA: hemolysin family protein [Acidimicrobiia bacterium]